MLSTPFLCFGEPKMTYLAEVSTLPIGQREASGTLVQSSVQAHGPSSLVNVV